MLGVFFITSVLLLPSVFSAETKYVFHYMPWFEGHDSAHWCNVQWGNSYYEPVMGKYDCRDAVVYTKQLQLMKAAGIDGLWIDFQLPEWIQRITDIANAAAQIGLRFAVVLDTHSDQNLALTAKQDLMHWMQMSNYYKIGNQPILPVFNSLVRPDPLLPDWTVSIAGTQQYPFLIARHDWRPGVLPNGYASKFFWLHSDVTWLKDYYSSNLSSFKVGSAFRGYRDCYASKSLSIPYLGYLESTLNLSALYRPEFVQVATWNDYSEGTMIEPSFVRGSGGCASTDLCCKGCPCVFRQDCTKPLGSSKGGPSADCHDMGSKSAYHDLGVIARHIKGICIDDAISEFQKILGGHFNASWDPDDCGLMTPSSVQNNLALYGKSDEPPRCVGSGTSSGSRCFKRPKSVFVLISLALLKVYL